MKIARVASLCTGGRAGGDILRRVWIYDCLQNFLGISQREEGDAGKVLLKGLLRVRVGA